MRCEGTFKQTLRHMMECKPQGRPAASGRPGVRAECSTERAPLPCCFLSSPTSSARALLAAARVLSCPSRSPQALSSEAQDRLSESPRSVMVEQEARILYPLCHPELCDLGRVAYLRGRVGSGRQGRHRDQTRWSLFCSVTRHVSPWAHTPPWRPALRSPVPGTSLSSGQKGSRSGGRPGL